MQVIFMILLGNLLNKPQKSIPYILSDYLLSKKKNVSHKRRNLNDVLQNIQTILPLGKWKDSRWKYFFTPGWIWKGIFLVCFFSKPLHVLFFWPVVGGSPKVSSITWQGAVTWWVRFSFQSPDRISQDKGVKPVWSDFPSPSCGPPWERKKLVYPRPLLAWCHTSSLQGSSLKHP